MLDLAGPCQAFYEAKNYGFEANLHYISTQTSVASYEGLMLSGIQPLPSSLSENAIVMVCGSNYHDDIYKDEISRQSMTWLCNALKPCTTLVGICTGAFLLGSAGLLNGRSCTTHHQYTSELAHRFPKAEVQPDRIFVQDGLLYTTAGVTAGIDLALHIIQNTKDAQLSMEIARDLVVYRRRMANDPQISQQITYRNHISPLVHSVQDYLQEHLTDKLVLTHIAEKFRVSVRHMQREFKNATCITIREYIQELRLEEAKHYLDKGETIETAAYKAGFPQTKALRLAWKKKYQSLPR